MAKEFKNSKEAAMEMTLEEAKAYRASLYKFTPRAMSEDEKRELFRIYWASQKATYGKGKALEKSIWLHLKTIGMNSPEQFEQGLSNFGLKKVK